VLDIATDAQIILACEEDPECFRDLFERHFAPVRAFLARRVGPELAEDLAVETFALAFRRRESYDARRASALPWLFGIAINLLRHHRRTERRKLIAYARSGVDPQPASDPGFEAAESRLEAQAAGPVLALALAKLRPVERDVLLLYAWADLTYSEIADALRIPVGTVRSRLSRARKQLRELLAASGQEFDGNTKEKLATDE
jgi:RNA polymerase sigma-70 factor (ECF subfamily)